MRVRTIQVDDPHDVTQFIAFPSHLYRDCPQWAPRLQIAARYDLNRAHPFYEHSIARFYLAESEGQVVGRLAVMDNRNYNAYTHQRAALFGSFESVDDRQVSQGLFEAAFAWARSCGLESIAGPIGLLPTDGRGLLVEGFERIPLASSPYNFPYYEAQLLQAGFQRTASTLSGVLDIFQPIPERFKQMAEQIVALRGFHLRSFRRKSDLYARIPSLGEAANLAFASFPLYYPPSEGELVEFADAFIALADPSLIKLVMKDEQVAGFILARREFSTALQKSNGQIWPFGWPYFLLERLRKPVVSIFGLALRPEYQSQAARFLLYLELVKTLRARNIQNVQVVQVDESNAELLSDLEAVSVRWHTRHNFYNRPLAL